MPIDPRIQAASELPRGAAPSASTRLSAAQVEGLMSLASGWRFGIDGRTERALALRGLLVMERLTLPDGGPIDLPLLTAEGARVAKRLRNAAIEAGSNVISLETARLRAAAARSA